METCKNNIFENVEKFHKEGYPGILVVYGEIAEPLVTGEQDQDVVVAASMCGEGRVIAFSHDQYGSEIFNEKGTYDNSTFYLNARKWVSQKEEDIKMLFLKDSPSFDKVEDLKAFDIVINTGEEKVKIEIMEQYLREGGGLIQAFTPWGWLQLNADKSLVDIPYSKLFNSLGIAFWNGVVYCDNLKVNRDVISKALVVGKSHQKQEEMEDLINNANFALKLLKLPFDQCLNLQPVIFKLWQEICSKVTGLCSSDRVSSNNQYEKIMLDTFVNLVRVQENKCFKAPSIKHFPGDYDNPPPRNCKSVSFKSTLRDVFFTSCHVPAGNVAYLKVTKIKGTWKLFLGAHSDCLTEDVCRRWPTIFSKHLVDQVKNYELSAPFGGSIYLLSPDDNDDAHIEANIDDVVFCPRYDIDDINVWRNSKNEPGIWADLSSKHVTFTFPSKSVRGIEDPKEVLELWDRLLEAYHNLKGTDINGYRKMWVVSDEQPVAGYMHAGYPIVTHLDVTEPNKDCFLLNKQSFLEGKFWGMFHEMGHNMQEDVWTFEGTSEVTVNIFSLHGMQVLCNKPILTHPWLQNHLNSTKQYLLKGAKFEEWQEHPGVGLYIYAQLAHHFSWDAYKKVFLFYNNLQEDKKPEELQDRIDLWFVIFSQTVQKNLTPWTDFWGIPLSEAANQKMKQYPYHIPDDEISQLDGNRLQNIIRAYQRL